MSLFGSLIKTALAKGASNVVDSATPNLTQRVRAQLGGVPAKAKSELPAERLSRNPLRTDNPGGDWLKGKLEYAEESRKTARPNTYSSTLGTSEGVTGYYDKYLQLDPKMLKDIKGAAGEELYRPQEYKINNLRKSIAEKGYQESPILIHVREDGTPFVVEGNHRIIEGIESNRKTIPVEVKYLRGSEELQEGILSPYSLDPRMSKDYKMKAGEKVTVNGVKVLEENAQSIQKNLQALKEDPSSIKNISERDKLLSDRQELIKSYKTVYPYTKENIPKPETMKQMKKALSVEKKEKLLKSQTEIKEGTDVDVRLDIPAYLKKILEDRAWIPTIKKTGEKGTFHTSTARMTNVTFDSKQTTMLKVATGKQSKTPAAVMKGKWKTTSNDKNYKDMQKFFDDSEWTQIGFDPERHSYFYNRSGANLLPVVSADEVIQVGPLVLAKNVVYGKRPRGVDKDFLYGVVGGGAALGAATDAALKSSDTKSKEPDAI